MKQEIESADKKYSDLEKRALDLVNNQETGPLKDIDSLILQNEEELRQLEEQVEVENAESVHSVPKSVSKQIE